MQEGDRVVSVNGTNVGASLNQNGVRITPHHTLSVITSHLISNHIILNSCVRSLNHCSTLARGIIFLYILYNIKHLTVLVLVHIMECKLHANDQSSM